MIQTVRILCLFFITALSIVAQAEPAPTRADYTLLNQQHYQDIVSRTRFQIQSLLAKLQRTKTFNSDRQMAFIANALADIPYSATDAIGEGDWQPRALTYQGGAVHLNQNPVYRLDKLNCQSFTEIALALMTSHNLNQFDKNFLNIAYGAASNPNGDIVRYYNRNHFVDGDFNPINQWNGLLKDVTTQNSWGVDAPVTSALITRQEWFQFQFSHLPETVQVLSNANGAAMVKRFLTTYSHLNYPHFAAEKVSISYLPKQLLALPLTDGGYAPNQTLLDAIPTPAVAEIVSDAKRWTIHGINIKYQIGSELSVSHLGVLYRQQFHYGDLIYHKIYCHHDGQGHTACQVIPKTCQKTHCDELMFAHATKSHPDGFYWYQGTNGQFVCARSLPKKITHYTRCNRVEALPLFDYLTEYQYGSYWYMNNPAILGVHIEKILS
ncbi:MAG: DUF1460 domain-containing protein [Gammaproteobacteria bacterium]|nr:DUF1460 domain-containing protein [Gammaproteobacteria bacterium]